MSTNILSANKLRVAYGHQVVLDDAVLALEHGERLGLVGRNGSGKSTLLKILAGSAKADSGEVTQRNGIRVGYLAQDFALAEELSVLENVLQGSAEVLAMVRRYDRLPPESEEAAELMEQISHFGGWTLEQRAESLLNELHAPGGERVVGELSGGEKRRVALCQVLLGEPDLLILDEPTNHLDTGAIEWLEQFLGKYRGTCLFVTHDRYFLDQVATRIVELRSGACESYPGNYTDYLLARAEREQAEMRQEHKRQRFLSRELEWVRRRPSARRTKSRDRIEKFFEVAAESGPEQEIDVELVIPPPPKLSDRVIEAKEISYSAAGRCLFENFSIRIAPGDRLGIVGRNGTGKSTLVRILLGLLPPERGEVEMGSRTEVNYVDQNRLLLDDQKAVWEEVGEGTDYVKLGEERISLRAYLRRFLFAEDRINTKIELLSGGERSRVLLAKILKRGGNVLVLDEPTNDLDLATLRVLEEALVSFGGCVIVVSHDRYFLNRVCTGILGFEGGGILHYQEGGYDYYLEKRASKEKVARAWQQVAVLRSEKVEQDVEPNHKTRKKLTNKERAELAGMEDQIMAKEERLAEIEAAFAGPDFYENHANDWQQLEAEMECLKSSIPALYDRWEELEARRD